MNRLRIYPAIESSLFVVPGSEGRNKNEYNRNGGDDEIGNEEAHLRIRSSIELVGMSLHILKKEQVS